MLAKKGKNINLLSRLSGAVVYGERASETTRQKCVRSTLFFFFLADILKDKPIDNADSLVDLMASSCRGLCDEWLAAPAASVSPPRAVPQSSSLCFAISTLLLFYNRTPNKTKRERQWGTVCAVRAQLASLRGEA